jgi:hypothetical protein
MDVYAMFYHNPREVALNLILVSVLENSLARTVFYFIDSNKRYKTHIHFSPFITKSFFF